MSVKVPTKEKGQICGCGGLIRRRRTIVWRFGIL